jgi:bifunctional DNA-binding transcriptional regulator/antitoxin component of YhaV-PrlF toxin-antitoxin module
MSKTKGYLVGPKGQIVIAKDIRERLGVEPGWIALQVLVDDRVEVFFVPPEHKLSLRGSLLQHTRKRVPAEDWPDARRTAWEQAAEERMSPQV